MRVLIDGTDIAGFRKDALRAWRRRMQMAFQVTYSSLNPRFTAAQIITEPVERLSRKQRKALAADAQAPVRVVGRPAAATRGSLAVERYRLEVPPLVPMADGRVWPPTCARPPRTFRPTRLRRPISST